MGAGATTEGIIRWAAHMHNPFEVSPQIIKRNLVEMGVALRTLKESQQIRRYRELKRYEKRVSENVGEVLEESAVSEAKVIALTKLRDF